MAGLWVVRDPFIEALLGRTWLPVSGVIAWLAPVGLTQSIGTTVGLIYMATGSTKLMMRWGLVYSAGVVLAFVVGLRWGYLGVAAAYAFANLILLYPVFTIPLRLVGLTFKDLLRAVGRQLVLAVCMGLILYVIDRFFLAGQGAWAKLLILVPSGLLIYALTGWMWMRSALQDVTTAFSRRGGKI
jgi:PST family polysaccharide transporter